MHRGSSPLTRGKLAAPPPTISTRRLIPAHAGKTNSRRRFDRSCRAHPRSRGENKGVGRDAPHRPGSSPLTRGKLSIAWSLLKTIGLIPAHAGKTHSLPGGHAAPGAHPRSRGENPSWMIASGGSGSSPLTRGKRPCTQGLERPRRLIPAHAGKTSWYSSSAHWTSAHPRSRGENLEDPYYIGTMRGSSPLTRGKHKTSRPGNNLQGLIPAHAGKTSFNNMLSPLMGAHPRSRGENHRRTLRPLLPGGSSPLTRGKPNDTQVPRRQRRLIPAHAGKTQSGCRCSSCRRAHPRSRGENTS